MGERRKANISFSISIECSVGYGGEDCATAYICRENIMCNQTLSYCNSEGECICRDASRECPPCNQDTTCSTTSGSSGGETDLAPIIAAAVVLVILGLVVIIIIVVVALILRHKKKEKQKSGELLLQYTLKDVHAFHSFIELTILTGPHDTVTSLTISSTSSPPNTIPMYSKVNKDKKKKGDTSYNTCELNYIYSLLLIQICTQGIQE